MEKLRLPFNKLLVLAAFGGLFLWACKTEGPGHAYGVIPKGTDAVVTLSPKLAPPDGVDVLDAFTHQVGMGPKGTALLGYLKDSRTTDMTIALWEEEGTWKAMGVAKGDYNRDNTGDLFKSLGIDPKPVSQKGMRYMRLAPDLYATLHGPLMVVAEEPEVQTSFSLVKTPAETFMSNTGPGIKAFQVRTERDPWLHMKVPGESKVWAKVKEVGPMAFVAKNINYMDAVLHDLEGEGQKLRLVFHYPDRGNAKRVAIPLSNLSKLARMMAKQKNQQLAQDLAWLFDGIDQLEVRQEENSVIMELELPDLKAVLELPVFEDLNEEG